VPSKCSIASRTDYDLKQHSNASGQRLEYEDPVTREKYIPYVVEPSFGLNRAILAVLCDAYREEEVKGETRVVLGLSNTVAPCKVAVFPLSKKDELPDALRNTGRSEREDVFVAIGICTHLGCVVPWNSGGNILNPWARFRRIRVS
jgi:glycyl-tRNA synthetase